MTKFLALMFLVASAVMAAQSDPSIAAGSTQLAVTWIEANQVRVARVGFDGASLDGAGLIVAPSTNAQSLPHIAFDGTNYLVVWAEDGFVRGRFFAPSGAFVRGPFTISSRGWVPGLAVTALPTEFFVAWSGDNPAGAASVRTDGVIWIKAETDAPGEIAVAAAGDSALIAFGSGIGLGVNQVWSTIGTMRLRGWAVTNRAGIWTQTTATVCNPRVAATPGGFLLGWTQQNAPGAGSQAYVATLDDTGKRTSEPLRVGTSFGPPARVVPFFDGVRPGFVTVDYPLLEIARVDGGKRTIAQADT